MNTTAYNPSPLEVELANVLEDLRESINDKLNGNTIINIDKNTNLDNPILRITTEDEDGDKHMVILKIIQKPDSLF